MTKLMVKHLWVGLVGATQRPGVKILGNCKGGYATVVASASGSRAFRNRVRKALDELGLDLIELDDVKVLTGGGARFRSDEELRQMARTVREIDSVAFGTFYVFTAFE